MCHELDQSDQKIEERDNKKSNFDHGTDLSTLDTSQDPLATKIGHRDARVICPRRRRRRETSSRPVPSSMDLRSSAAEAARLRSRFEAAFDRFVISPSTPTLIGEICCRRACFLWASR